jgi:hypothetical protein
MSNLENNVSSQVFSFTFPAMVSGTQTSGSANAVLNANFLLGVSRVMGLVRTTSGGTVGTPYIASIAVPAGGTAAAKTTTIVLNSSVNTDTSVYTLYWQNETLNAGFSSNNGTISNPALTVLNC